MTKKLFTLSASLVVLTLGFVFASANFDDRPAVVSAAPEYIAEEVTFPNGGITLAGTLTLPDNSGPHPAVVLMSGTGPQDRNSEIVSGFRLFEIVADYLTSRGVAVLRYDDRSVGGSTGDYKTSGLDNFASDAKAAVAYLRTRPEIDRAQVGLYGHSEGGMYAAMLGADPAVQADFIVSVAGIAVDGESLLLHQNALIFRGAGAPEALVQSQVAYLEAVFDLAREGRWEEARQLAYDTAIEQWQYFTPGEQAALGGDQAGYAIAMAEAFVATQQGAWLPSFLDHDPGADWAKVTAPVLAIYGGKDVQVDEAQNAGPMLSGLLQAPTTDYTLVVLPDANHLMQPAITGNIDEYATLPATYTPDLLPTVGDWILRHVQLAP